MANISPDVIKKWDDLWEGVFLAEYAAKHLTMSAEDLVRVDKMLTKTCEQCGKDGLIYRRNTAYGEDAWLSNWGCACPECQVEDDKYWSKRWAEYYSMVL